MSATVIQKPVPFSPVSNYMWCVAKGTPAYVAMDGYYIQFNVANYSTSAELIKNNIKVYSGTNSGYAVYDIHETLKNYVSYDIRNCQGTLGTYNSSSTNLFRYKVAATEFSSTTVLSTNASFCDGYVFNGAINKSETFLYTDYIPTGNGKFLSKWEGERIVRPTDYGALCFTNNLISTAKVYGMAVDVYYEDGSMKSFTQPNSLTASTGIFSFGSGYYEVNNSIFATGYTLDYHNIFTEPWAFSQFILTGATKYVVKMIDQWTNRCSEEITYRIDRDCALTDNIQLMWLNKLGGFEGYTFYRENRQFIDRKIETFRKNDYISINGTMYSKPEYYGETVLDIKATEKFVVKSKVVTDEMSRNLSSIFESPIVFMLKDGGTKQYLIEPVIIEEDSKEIQRNQNRPDRAIVTFTFRKANQNVTQA